ncbi:TPA: restriction endonuclease subunit S [Klebsiella pneumoniae]|nr:restriction endonuclease subunit S [Klebsiella pneumoniae]HDQ3433198.1 restriction endonuclease subunit S [Klebsiella pneumoniae]HEE0491892.1 restriction endonuclease subunit S [Klebsiella pneumoniae]
MVPKGWTLLQVSDICKLQNGNSFKPHEWDTQGLPIIRIQNLNGSDNYNYFSGVPQDKWLVEPGQLLFSWAGTKGVSFGPFIWNGPKGVLNQHIYKVFANENVHGHWLYLALLHITQKIEAQAHGFKSTLLHVQKKDIDNQFVLTPPVAEQKKIAQILSTWDKAISVTKNLLTNSQQQKKALMQQLLTGKKRLLNENGVRFSGEWRNSTLSMFCNIAKGKALSASDLEVGDFPVIAGGKISPYSHSDYTHENVVTVSASGAYAGYISYHNYKIWASDCSVVSAKADNLIDYFYQLLLSLQDKIYSLQSGGAQPHIYPKDLNSIPLWVPCVKEQQKIAAVLSAADAEISTLEKKLACLRDEKKALMQQLLTGKRRVKVDEAVAE